MAFILGVPIVKLKLHINLPIRPNPASDKMIFLAPTCVYIITSISYGREPASAIGLLSLLETMEAPH
jgi:hypothetical protein